MNPKEAVRLRERWYMDAQRSHAATLCPLNKVPLFEMAESCSNMEGTGRHMLRNTAQVPMPWSPQLADPQRGSVRNVCQECLMRQSLSIRHKVLEVDVETVAPNMSCYETWGVPFAEKGGLNHPNHGCGMPAPPCDFPSSLLNKQPSHPHTVVLTMARLAPDTPPHLAVASSELLFLIKSRLIFML